MIREITTTLTAEEFEDLIKNSISEGLKNHSGGSGQEFMRPDDVADLLGVSKVAVYGLVARKAIPYVKRGHYLVFKRSELIKWINSGRETTAEDLSN